MKNLLMISIGALFLCGIACTRKVRCESCALSVHAVGFDSMEIVNSFVERYTPPGFNQFAGRDSVIASNIRRVDPDSPGAGYAVDILYTIGGNNYKIRVGNKVTTLSDIYYDEEVENQGWGMGEIDLCWSTVHYTLDGKSYSKKPNRSGPIDLYVLK